MPKYDESVRDLVDEIKSTKKEIRKLNHDLREKDYQLKEILVKSGDFGALTINYKVVERIFGR